MTITKKLGSGIHALIAAVLILAGASSSRAAIYMVALDGVTWRFGSVDPTTGAFTPIVALPSADGMSSMSALDSAAGLYRYWGPASGGWALYTVDVTTGSVSAGPVHLFGAPYWNRAQIEVACTSGTIYMVAVEAGVFHLGTVDALTGGFTSIAPLPSADGMSSTSCLNAAAGLYHYWGPAPGGLAMFTVDVTTGSVSSGPVHLFGAPYWNRAQMAIDSSTGTIYMVAFEAGINYFGSVDPASGAFTSIAALPSADGMSSTESMDAAAGLYYYWGLAPGGRALVSVDVTSGVVTVGPTILFGDPDWNRAQLAIDDPCVFCPTTVPSGIFLNSIPESQFCGSSPNQRMQARTWFLNQLALAQGALDGGNCPAASAHLTNVLGKADGCGSVPDNNDKLCDCPAQAALQQLVGPVLAGITGCCD